MRIRKENLQRAGSLGGRARMRLYGNLGTSEGRRRGGLASLKTHAKLKTGFKLLRKISTPRHSTYLAELMGVLMGDGHVDKYQTSIVTHSETDHEHLKYVEGLFNSVFPTAPLRIIKRRDKNALVLTISSKRVSEILVDLGMVQGDKIKGQVQMPTWIARSKAYQRAWARGLLDTDGCVFLDSHKYKEKVYRNIGIAFSNRASGLLNGFNSVLESYGLRTTQTSRFAVFLRRKEDIRRYFEVIGTSNPKHRRKIERYFLFKNGGVA